MNRRQLAARLAEKTGLSARRAAQVLQVLPGLVAGELARAGSLEWRGLGTFAVRRYPPRQIHVPATGQTIDLPARAGVSFKPSKNLLVTCSPSRSGEPQMALDRLLDKSDPVISSKELRQRLTAKSSKPVLRAGRR